MDIPNAVLVIVGRQTIELAILKGQLKQAIEAARETACPDPAEHPKDVTPTEAQEA